jgi:AcrR family transcriptional regulator
MPMATPYPVAARELLRNTLLDAARDQLTTRTWDDVTMAEVARAAGVSRQTLYNEFGSRHEFAVALVMREGDRFLGAVEGAILGRLDDPVAALQAAFGLLPLVTTQGQPVVERAAERLAAVIATGWPRAAPEDAELLAECLVRLAISYAALPKGSAQQTAAALTRLLGPFIERALA